MLEGREVVGAVLIGEGVVGGPAAGGEEEEEEERETRSHAGWYRRAGGGGAREVEVACWGEEKRFERGGRGGIAPRRGSVVKHVELRRFFIVGVFKGAARTLSQRIFRTFH